MRRQDLPEPATSPAPRLDVYVTGDVVNVRAGASTDYQVIDQARRGDLGQELARSGEWVRLRLERDGIEGWIFGRYVSHERPTAVVARQAPKAEQRPTAQPPAPTLSDDAIRHALVEASIAGYPGSCPCPYHVDRGGRRCGGRSAYSRPGGASPYCYPQDVPASAVAEYREWTSR
jgi:SH3-like domain-containing protein